MPELFLTLLSSPLLGTGKPAYCPIKGADWIIPSSPTMVTSLGNQAVSRSLPMCDWEGLTFCDLDNSLTLSGFVSSPWK